MIRIFMLGALIQFISYVNLVINYRAVAHNQVLVAMATDGLAVIISVLIVQRIANPERPIHWSAQEWGLVVGGSLAALVGMWLTRTWG